MTDGGTVNATISKFGYPDTLVADYRHWVVLLRQQQVTLGSLILACRGPATAFAGIGAEAFAELQTVAGDIETSLAQAFSFEKINYLMLMMVDPHVHFHVLPRYSQARRFADMEFVDAGWPGVPDLSKGPLLEPGRRADLATFLRNHWSRQHP